MRIVLFLIAAASVAACSREKPAETRGQDQTPAIDAFEPTTEQVALAQPPVVIEVETPEMNARRGRILYITNGCVICHQVNGVGGRAAPDLTATTAPATVNPLEFSARIWRGAPAMTALQAIELGYVINLDAQDLADLAAFAASTDEQKLLSAESVSAEMRGWFLDDPHWTSGDWTEYLKRGDRLPGMDEDIPN